MDGDVPDQHLAAARVPGRTPVRGWGTRPQAQGRRIAVGVLQGGGERLELAGISPTFEGEPGPASP